MVAAFLQDDLAAELERILQDFRLKDPRGNSSKINIFLQRLPMLEPLEQDDIPVEALENGLADQQTAMDPYPYIIVRIDDGEIKDEDSAQTVNINLLIGTYEPDYDKQGHKDVLNIITKLYDRFARMPVLNGKYTIQYPVLWALQEEESYPFYFGGMNLTFEIAAVRREDEYS